MELTERISNILKFPGISGPAGGLRRGLALPEEDGSSLDPALYPSGRVPEGTKPLKDERALIANMNGHVTLTGGPVDLQFNRGLLRRICRGKNILLDRLDCRSYFSSSSGRTDFTNESAFSFDSETEYGLRSVQVSTGAGGGRIVTDFVLTRVPEEMFFMFSVEYPEFEEHETVTEAAVMEFSLFNSSRGITVKALDAPGESLKVMPDDHLCRAVPGHGFELSDGRQTLRLSGLSEYRGSGLSEIKSLALRTAVYRGRKVLLVNPGGSYSPAPASCYSKIRERFCFRFELIQQ